jgi:hypothetical protein
MSWKHKDWFSMSDSQLTIFGVFRSQPRNDKKTTKRTMIQQHAPPNHDTSSPTTMVRFNDTITIHDFEKYGSEESSLFWWSQDEQAEIVKQCQRIVSLLQSSCHYSSLSPDKSVLVLEQSNVDCSRGLEQFLPGAVAEQQRLVPSQAHKAILMAQAEQQKRGIHDPQCLAQIYLPYSLKCIELANLRAILDEQFVRSDDDTATRTIEVPDEERQQQGPSHEERPFSYSDKCRERYNRSKQRRKRKIATEAA